MMVRLIFVKSLGGGLTAKRVSELRSRVCNIFHRQLLHVNKLNKLLKNLYYV